MVPNANARHFRLKAAQRDLISAAGGIERAALICSYSKSAVGRWAHIDSVDLMPIEAVDRLEVETGRNDFTNAWMESRGLKIADEAAKSVCLSNEMSGFVVEFGSLLSEWGAATADGKATPTEADRLMRQLSKMLDRVPPLRDALADVVAQGGKSLASGLRVVGD